MKKAIRLTAYAVILSLAISMLSACTLGTKNTDTSTTSASVTDASGASTSVSEESSINEASAKEDKTTTASAVTKAETDSIDTILTLISDYPQGTAGSTLKCVEIAIRLINFSRDNGVSSDKIKKDIDSYFSKLSADEKTQFESNLYEIDYTARKLIKGDVSSLQNYIDQSSEKYDKGKYSLDKYEEIYKLMANS